jgi:Septum formation
MAQVCARCGAPVGYQPPAEGPAAAQPAGRSVPSRLLLIAVGVAMALGVGAGLLITGLAHWTSSVSDPTASQVSDGQLRSGDCLTGSNLSLDTNSDWPDTVAVVPCTHWHIAEVFFAGNAWPQSMAYPGDNKVNSRSEARCDAAFLKYDGIAYPNSMFTYDYIVPDNTTWPAGDRWMVCVAYDATSAYPGGAPVNYSIKGSSR